jgi:hypothetical protein
MDEDKYDVSQYTDKEIYEILDLNHPTDRELEARIVHLINKYSNMQNDSGYKLAIFFQNIYYRFFEAEGEEENEDNGRITEGFEEKNTDPNQPSKNANKETTSGAKEISTEIQNTISFDYTKDKYALNPLLKQTIKRIISVDSQYRDNKNTTLSTDFTFNLSETLKNVVSLKLESIQIPITWYTISNNYGSNFFYLKGNADGINNGYHDYKIQINPGNYVVNSGDDSDIITTINKSINDVSNTYTDVNFGKTGVTYNNGNAHSTVSVDIQKVYNESCFYLEFPYWTPSVNSNLTATQLDAYRTDSIPSYLGFNKTVYQPFTTHSNPSYVLTSVINNASVKYQVDSSNNYFNIIHYDGATDYSSSSKIYNTIQISITNGSYYRSGLITEINKSLSNSIYLDSSSCIYQVDITDPSMINYSYSYYEMRIKLNRYTIKQIPNSKIAVVFPDESTLNRNTIWSVYSVYNSALFFENRVNEMNTLYAESNSIKSSFTINANTTMYFKCVSPPNYASTEDFSKNDIIVNIPQGVYVINNLLDQINAGFTSANKSYGKTIFNTSSNAFVSNNSFHLNLDITNNFTNSKYKISFDKTSILNKYMGIPVKSNYTLSDICLNQFDGSFNNQIGGYIVDSSYILTYAPYGTDGNSKDIARNIYLPKQTVYAYSTFLDLVNAVQTAIRSHTVVDICNNEVQSPFGNSLLIPSTSSDNTIVNVVLKLDVIYNLTENNYYVYFKDKTTNDDITVGTNSWNNLNIDYSYNLYQKKKPRDPSGESESYSSIISNSQIKTNQITINNTNNKINIIPYYDSLGGAYTTSNNIILTVPNGSYTKFQLITQLNSLLSADARLIGSYFSIYVKNNNEYVSMHMNINIIYTTNDYKLVFYNPVDFVKCFIGAKSVRNTTWDSTLGWVLGFRDHTEYVLTESNVVNQDTSTYYTDSPLSVYTYTDYYGLTSSQIVNTVINITGDTSTTLSLYNYFLIVLNDYIQNHLNDGLVSITSGETSIPLPGYSNKSTITVCDPVTNAPVTSSSVNIDSLTQKQIYALNQSVISNKNQVKKYSAGPNIHDVFAIVPLKIGGINNGEYYVESGGNLQNQERVYFGPVNISRMSIKLINDKGDIVDLNKSNWSFSFICEQLYIS